jgi:putative ABC transport system permease protein
LAAGLASEYWRLVQSQRARRIAWELPMRLGLLDLFRAKLRFGLLAGALAVLVFLLLFLNTISATLLGFLTGALQHNSADVLVYSVASRRNLQASRLDPSLLAKVRAVPGVAAAGPIGQTTLSANVGRGLTDLSLFGYEPGKPGGPARIVSGRAPGPGEALVDRSDAPNGFRIGATIVLEPTGRRLKIVGYTEGSRFNAAPTAYTTIGTYRGIVTAANPKAPFVPDNLVGVEVAPGAAVSSVAAAIDASTRGVEALPRAEAVASIPGVSSITASFDLIVGITFVIVAVVTGFFFLILTVQKLWVFAGLRALGATSRYLAASVLTQVVAVVAAGVAAATAMLAAAAAVSSPAFPLAVDTRLVLLSALAVLGSSVAASLLAVRRVTRTDPLVAAGAR